MFIRHRHLEFPLLTILPAGEFRRTLSVRGTERACEALDGCFAAEEFNSPVLRIGPFSQNGNLSTGIQANELDFGNAMP